MVILIKIIQFVLCLSILIIVHEFGHFFFARLFKMRVDKFYMFFNAYGSIVKAKKINGKWKVKWFSRNDKSTRIKLDENGEEVRDKKGRKQTEQIPANELSDDNWNKYPETTEWGLGWLPFGGYCKINGMIDESMDKEHLKQPEQPYEFRAKPAWQRLLVMIGGVLFNIILAILIYWGILFTWGEDYIANRDVKNGIVCSSLAQEIGFRNGDRILTLDGNTVERFGDITINIIRDRVKNVEVERDGEKVIVPISDTCISKILKNREFISPRIQFIVSNIQKESPAQKAGFEENDRVIAIGSQHVEYFDEIAPLLNAHASLYFQQLISVYRPILLQLQAEIVQKLSLKAKSTDTVHDSQTVYIKVLQSFQYLHNYLLHNTQPLDITIVRNNDTLVLATEISKNGTIGVGFHESALKITHLSYGFFEAMPAGINKGIEAIKDYIKDLGLIFSPKTKAYESVGSFLAIGNIFPDKWDWEKFWKLTALLSIMLAVINILPIPALDGGHTVFILYEIIFRRKPSDKVLEYAQMVGFFILLCLMVFALRNDIINFILK